MNTKEVVEWMQRFTQRDYEAHLASYSPELDDETYTSRFVELDRLYALEEDVYTGISRGREMSEQAKARCTTMRERLTPRVLFQLKKYAHPEMGELYRAYVSGEFKHNVGAYNLILTLAHTKHGLQIVSVDSRCMNCRGSGREDGEACQECGGKGWEHESGRKLGELGAPVEVIKLQAPTNPESRADYEST
ncbi:hypothetical protein [Vitiosangium sp. GDMCC 1.1324]|uniref:hypothetical protein n=1 Tax=Vitiosangium sp. (strain GDMCC 1.1324) TaxID=2138576 RepID=UPI000D33498B|nr:hypothetical protein [Vitiosangium sp. GDMCC 1.1324]PTL85200.1 hypothetical protein DAT35_00270 [Vitiosangium sp. GDMCC 1.1324]